MTEADALTGKPHALLALVVVACNGTSPNEPALFPVDYGETYQEVRNCRFSLDHDLMRIRILASPDALGAYTNRTDPFPIGAIVLKEQYDDGDTNCEGEIFSYTVMRKLGSGTDPASLDWEWQEADRERRVVTDTNLERCTQCHTDCGRPPEGYDGTCAVP